MPLHMEYLRSFSLGILVLVSISRVEAQFTREDIDAWIDTLPYARAESVDSLPIWEEELRRAGRQINYPRGLIYATRFRAYYHDFKGELEEATKYYLKFLDEARSYQLPDDEISAVLDLVYVYTNTLQLGLAKKLLINQLARLDHPSVSDRKRSMVFNNLGLVYTQLGLPDSAIIAYDRALAIKESINDSLGIANLRINLSALHNRQGNFREASRLAQQNIEYLKNQNTSDLIYNLINKAGAENGLQNYGIAEELFLQALTLADSIHAIQLKDRTLANLAGFYQDRGDFRKAYEYLLLNNEHRLQMMDDQTTSRIAELREQYEADKREQENLLLTTNLSLEKNKRRQYLVGLLATLLVSLTIGVAWWKNRSKNLQLQQQNELISRQKNTLSRLNAEKNTLISIVSHDLSSPLSTIKVWAQGLTASPGDEFEETKSVILNTADKALQSVRKILHVETEEIRPLELQEVSLSEIVITLKESFEKQASKKEIQLAITGEEDLTFVTDREMLLRALENLLANAIKFSPRQRIVQIGGAYDDDYISFYIRDQGPGIPKDEQTRLFTKYFQGSTKPTAGEPTTGLGLHIVKRIADELGATVDVESDLSNGSTFTFRLKR